MKRFTWRLQRVLDIRTKEEQKKTAELLEITDKLVAARSELLIKRKLLENIINGLTAERPKKRLVKQEFFLAYSYTSNKQIKKLKEKIYLLETQQKNKIMEVLKVRRSKEGLERLRNEAKTQYIKEQEKLEQKEFDDRATVSFVRSPRS
jgi:flagellar biosynthesis chaperone FliJ